MFPHRFALRPALIRPPPRRDLRWLAAVPLAAAGTRVATEVRKPETHRRRYEHLRLENGMQAPVEASRKSWLG